MEILVDFAGKFLELTVEPIARQFGYVLFYRSNVDELRRQVEKLKTRRGDVQLSIDTARRNCKEIKPNVQDWIRRVDEIIEEDDKFCQEESRANTRCSYRSCPNLWLRHQISRKAKKMAADVDQLKRDATSEEVSFEPLPKCIGPSSMGKEEFESRISKMKEIMEALADPAVYMIGLHGLGGVGKTTLSKQVAKKAEEEKLFDMVVWVEVKLKPFKEIQSQIAYKLGLKFDMQNDDEITRANLLQKRLEQEKSLLVLLDDLWRRLDLDQVGIPLADEGNKPCKIILTSRNENVLISQMNCTNNIKLELLSENEALRLFKRESELRDDSDDPDLLSIAAEVAQECAKLPVAIVTVARALRNNKNPKNWSDALLQLRRRGFRNIPGVDDEVYSSIKLSYDYLESQELKSTFLLSAKLSQDPAISDMLMYCVGLGFLEGVHNMKEARVRLDTLIQQLKASSLLLDSSLKDHFTIHDVVCDVALSIAFEEQHALVKSDEKVEWPDEDQLESCTAICLNRSDIYELPEELYGPKVEFFLLNNKDPYLRIPSGFFKGMQKLKVLNLKDIAFSSLLLSVNPLQKLRMLSLPFCQLENIIGVEHLKKLKILNLSWSTIKRLPCEVGHLVCLQILNLSYCRQLEVIPPIVLSNLKNLEELYMLNSFHQWEGEGLRVGKERASLVELQHLRELSTLEIDIHYASMLPKDLFLENSLERYRICIGRGYDLYSNCESSRKLALVLDNNINMEYGIFRLLESVEDLCLANLNGITNLCQFHITAQTFCKLKAINLSRCSQLKFLFSITMTETLSRIEEIEVSYCESMKGIVAFLDTENVEKGSPMSIIEFPQLRRLTLNKLPELTEFCFSNMVFPKLERLRLSGRQAKMMCNGKFPPYYFPNVTYLHLCDTNNEVATFPYDLFHGFPNLAELEVSSCSSFSSPGLGVSVHQDARNVAPQKKLILDSLDWLKHVWNEKCELDVFLKNLETLKVSNCSILITFGPSCVSLDNLTNLDVIACDGLINLLTSSTARTLVQLKNLRIGRCKKIEEIITKEEEDVETEIVFMKLERLTLDHLSSCKSFCCHNYTFKFPSLNEVTIVECFKLRIFCPGFLTAPLLKGVKVMNNEIYWKDNLNKTIQQLFDEKHFHATHLKIDEYSALIDMWNGKLVIPDHSFNNLTRLIVNKCPFNHVIPSSVLTSLMKLEVLEVRNCDSVEVVFDLEGINIDKEAHNLQAIPLRHLKLEHLPKLKYIWNKDPRINCFPHLSEMSAYECKSLTSIFPASIAEGLTKLECLRIESSEVEVIVAEDQTPKPTIHFVFPRLSSLDLLKLPNLKNFYPQRHTVEWSCLRTLNVRHCEKLKVFSWEVPKKTEEDGEDEIENQYPLLLNEKVVSKLEQLILCGRPFEMMWNGKFPPYRFPNVTYLYIRDIYNKVVTFPYDLYHGFPNLAELEVRSCSFEVIFSWPGLGVPFNQDARNVAPLKKLILDSLDRLKNVWNEKCELDVVFQNLETFEVSHCSRLITLGPSYVSLDNLRNLDVSFCHGLINLLTSSTAKTLVQLKRLRIRSCDKIEEIITKGEEDVETEIVFMKLERLTLDHLSRCKSFCCHNYTFKFPSLNEVIIISCLELRIFCPGILITPLLKSVKVDNKIHWKNNLDQTIQQLFDEKCFHATYLKIDEHPKLIDIWNGKLAIPDHSFNNLRKLVVNKCPFLSNHVIPSYVLTSLIKLQILEVRNCDSVEVVFDLEGINIDKEAHTSQAIPLKHLTLEHLPKLKYVWNKDPRINCFPYLFEMFAYECESLTSIFPASIAKGLTKLRYLNIESCGVEVIVAEDQTPRPIIHFVFPQLSSLNLLKLPNLKNFYPQRHTVEWPCLSTLNVRHCDKLKVFSWEVPKKTEEDGEDEIENQYPLLLIEKVIPKLKSLALNQNDVKMISNYEFQDDLFNKAGDLYLYSFNDDESFVFPYSLLERFPNLCGLHVEHSSFEHIFPCQGTCGDPSIKVPQPRHLFLTHLDRLHNIWNEDSPIHPSLQTLEELEVEHCSKLINLAPSSASFDNLSRLKVFGCHRLGYLLTTFTARSLVHLDWLEIGDCKMMEEIVKYEGEDVEYIIALKYLAKVKFVDLPVLKSFCTQTYTFEFPILRNVRIRGCPKMKMFCQGVLNTPWLKAVEVGENEERWEENLNKTVEQLFSERGCQNSLEG